MRDLSADGLQRRAGLLHGRALATDEEDDAIAIDWQPGSSPQRALILVSRYGPGDPSLPGKIVSYDGAGFSYQTIPPTAKGTVVTLLGLGWHRPKLPGLGDVAWPGVFAALTDSGYNGPVCIEVEDRAYERSLEDRKRSLRQAAAFLRQFVAE